MSETAQFYEKLLNDAVRKQIIILGKQIVLMKARNVQGLQVTDEGTVSILSEKPEEVVTHFLEEFRSLSAPLVKKTMQPLLSALGTTVTQLPIQTATQPKPLPEKSDPPENLNIGKPESHINQKG